MKITCPSCRTEIPADDVNVREGVAFCRSCDNGFALSDLLGSRAGGPQRAERPERTKVAFMRERSYRLAAVLPRGGPRGLGCFMTFFTLFWNGITWTFVITDWTVPESGFGWFGRLFMIPFVIVGVVTLLIALWVLFGRTGIAMDRDALLLRRHIFGLKFQKRYALADISRVGLAEAYKQNDVPVYGVGIFLKDRRSPVTFGSGLTEDEKNWLVWEMYDFWREVTERRG